jgi:chromate reductase
MAERLEIAAFLDTEIDVPPPRILAFAGSARRESFNRKFLAIAAEATRAAGAEVTLAELRDYPLPLFNEDWEEENGMPAPASKLVELIRGHHGLLVASPEYNSLITPLLKNTIDWCSRAEPNPFASKAALVITASPGAYGGVKSGLAARQLLNRLGCLLVPVECALPQAHEAFDPGGHLQNDRVLESVKRAAAQLAQIAAKFNA